MHARADCSLTETPSFPSFFFAFFSLPPPFLSQGHVYYDRTKAFFPEKSDGAAGLLSFAVIRNSFRALSAGRGGDATTGTYDYKGGVLVVGPGDQGVLYEFRENTYGELADVDAIAAAVDNFDPLYEFTPPSSPGDGSDGGDGPVNAYMSEVERARL